MKKCLTLCIIIISNLTICGQKSDYIIQLNSGVFKFNGSSIENSGMINYNIDNEDGYTNNPYGDKATLSYGISTGYTKTIKSNFRFGADIGYEVLRSKINIEKVWQHNRTINEVINAKGQTYINFNFINVYPRIGYLFLVSKFNISIDMGIEYGYCLKATEKGFAKSSLREYKTIRDRKTNNSDIRPRIQIGVISKHFGGYIGYSRGLLNYKSGYIGGTSEAFSEIFRIGITYKL